VAEDTGGVYTHINDSDSNLATLMSSFYLFYASGNADTNASLTVTSPYFDFSTGTPMITMALPVYIDNVHFVGVVGIDLPLTLLSEAIGDVVIGHKSYSFIVNSVGEALIHPLLADPLTSSATSYSAVFISDLEPSELDVSALTNREDGFVQIQAELRQPAGDATYNGFITNTVDLIYFYAGVGPSSLSVGFAIFTEPDIAAPDVQQFGLLSSPSPSNACEADDASPSNCVAPFVLFHDLDRMLHCYDAEKDKLSWVADASIEYDSATQIYLSKQYMSWYLQPGGFENPMQAVLNDVSCEQIDALHSLTNGLGSITNDELPFEGFREEIATQLLNAIKVLQSMAKFWGAAYADAMFMCMYFGTYHGMMLTFPGQSIGSTYNPLLRPWYQRATAYPGLLVITTPYTDFFTGQLIMSGALAMAAPHRDDPYGVVGFDFEFAVLTAHWRNSMSSSCGDGGNGRCYLIDASAFLLYYDGIENDAGDDDIEHKFFGDLEPTLMQSLLQRALFVKQTNPNYLTATVDIAYLADTDNINAVASASSGFTSNTGAYTIQQIAGTNLFVVHIANYAVTTTYPTNCPNPSHCSLVQSPGVSSVSSLVGVCHEPEVPDTATASECVAISDSQATAVCLSDMCGQCTESQQKTVWADCDAASTADTMLAFLAGLALWCSI